MLLPTRHVLSEPRRPVDPTSPGEPRSPTTPLNPIGPTAYELAITINYSNSKLPWLPG